MLFYGKGIIKIHLLFFYIYGLKLFSGLIRKIEVYTEDWSAFPFLKSPNTYSFNGFKTYAIFDKIIKSKLPSSSMI